VFHNSGYKRALCGSQWDPVLGITGEYNAFNDLGNSKASHGCCPAGKYMSSPFLTFSETNSCTRCREGTYTSVPNDDTSCSICPEGKTNDLGSAGISSCLSSILLCTWHDETGRATIDGSTNNGVAVDTTGTHDVPEEGCKLSYRIKVYGDMTIEGVIGSYYELQSSRVDKLATTVLHYQHRHFFVKSSGILTLKYLKLTWGEVGKEHGGSVVVSGGTFSAIAVHFYGLATTSPEGHAIRGGAVYISNGAVIIIKDSTFEGFSAQFGGAIYVSTTSSNHPMTIESTIFKNNFATVRFIFNSFFFECYISLYLQRVESSLFFFISLQNAGGTMAVYSGASVTFVGRSNVMTSNCDDLSKCTGDGKNIYSVSSNLKFEVCKPGTTYTPGLYSGNLDVDYNGCPVALCTWPDEENNGVAFGTTGKYYISEAGCKMSKRISVYGDMTVEGEIGNYHELLSNRVDNKVETASQAHRHFSLFSPGKLTLKYLKLTWGECGTQSGGSIYQRSGTLDIDGVQFDGSATTSTEKHAGYGGAIRIEDGAVIIKDSTFEGFRAKFGGAISVLKTSTAMIIESTTFKNNEATVSFSILYEISNK
jgi:hypothetical protein